MSLSQPILLSIAIPTLGHSFRLEKLLNSLSMQSLECKSFEVLIIKNGSQDKPLDLSKKEWNFKIRVINLSSIGVANARNIAIAESHGSIIYFLDDDCYLNDSHHLRQLMHMHQSMPRVTVIGGIYKSEPQAKLSDKVFNATVEIWSLKSQKTKIHLIPGGNLSLKKDLIGNTRFNSNLKNGGEETDFLRRLQLKGHLVFSHPTLNVVHSPYKSFFQVWKKAYNHGCEKQRQQQQQAFTRDSLSFLNQWPFSLKVLLIIYAVFDQLGVTVESIKQILKNLYQTEKVQKGNASI